MDQVLARLSYSARGLFQALDDICRWIWLEPAGSLSGLTVPFSHGQPLNSSMSSREDAAASGKGCPFPMHVAERTKGCLLVTGGGISAVVVHTGGHLYVQVLFLFSRLFYVAESVSLGLWPCWTIPGRRRHHAGQEAQLFPVPTPRL